MSKASRPRTAGRYDLTGKEFGLQEKELGSAETENHNCGGIGEARCVSFLDKM